MSSEPAEVPDAAVEARAVCWHHLPVRRQVLLLAAAATLASWRSAKARTFGRSAKAMGSSSPPGAMSSSAFRMPSLEAMSQ